MPRLLICRIFYSLALAGLEVLAASGSVVLADEAAPSFERDVQPILAKYCTECHGEKKTWAALDLRTPAGLAVGGENGPAISIENVAESLLLENIRNGSMPPEDKPRPTEAEVALLQNWISSITREQFAELAKVQLKADDLNYWAFQRLAKPELPKVAAADRIRTPIDAFVLQKLEAKGLTLSSDVERLALLRRATFDLIGLPPAPDEIEAWLADDSPEAYDKLLDRLLGSPHYGERWGRHWLDSAGYADTIKTDNDIDGGAVREGLWRYRDYVVRSLNDDKPYDQFVREQLAGDELTGLAKINKLGPERLSPEKQELLIATGMLRTAVDGTNNFERNRPQERFELLYDTIENLSSNLFGLTMACARCHDHKFDPISQRDYYGLMACLTPAYNPEAWLQPQFRHLMISTEAELAEIKTFNDELNKKAGELGGQQHQLRQPYHEKVFEQKLAGLPEAIREDVRVTLKTGEGQRTEVQKYLFEKFSPQLAVTNEDITAALSPTDRELNDKLQWQIDDLRAKQRQPQKLQALFELGAPPATHILRRGNFETPGRAVTPALPEVLGGEAAFVSLKTSETGKNPTAPTLPPGSSALDQPKLPDPEPPEAYSGRRLALAQGLTEPNSRAAGLLARVMVNRLWQHHFGRGIVATPGNFGRSGSGPSHVELLDWLASDLVEGGWRLKRLHKLIMQSSVYRQSAMVSPEQMATAVSNDAENVLLWRMPLRRLESEAVRDAILATSGRLDRSIGGPPILLSGRPDGTVVIKDTGLETPSSAQRRSIYLLARRNFNLSFLSAFDQPLMATNCSARNRSVVVGQSLAMLNDAFVQTEADHFATRVQTEAGTEPVKQIERAFIIALGRQPNAPEQTWSSELLKSQDKGLATLCHMLLNTNEFLYIE